MKAISIRLAQEELEQVEDLAGAGYGPDKIAMYLDVDKTNFMKEWKNPDSLIRYHYNRGVLLTDANIALKLEENAKGGNITAIQQLVRIRTEQFVNDCKNEIYFNNEVE